MDPSIMFQRRFQRRWYRWIKISQSLLFTVHIPLAFYVHQFFIPALSSHFCLQKSIFFENFTNFISLGASPTYISISHLPRIISLSSFFLYSSSLNAYTITTSIFCIILFTYYYLKTHFLLKLFYLSLYRKLLLYIFH